MSLLATKFNRYIEFTTASFGDKTIGIYITANIRTIKKKYEVITSMNINKLEALASKLSIDLILKDIHIYNTDYRLRQLNTTASEWKQQEQSNNTNHKEPRIIQRK